MNPEILRSTSDGNIPATMPEIMLHSDGTLSYGECLTLKRRHESQQSYHKLVGGSVDAEFTGKL